MAKKLPPTGTVELDHRDTTITIDDLENGKTYYWTVIPSLNGIDGTCCSGVWSFTVEIPLPEVVLMTPGNNSVITSKQPTLAWSLEYSGTGSVTYNVYLGTELNLELLCENITDRYFSITTPLEDNTTYYWQVIPWAGRYEGIGSELWAFTVKPIDNKIPRFGCELYLETTQLEIKPGEVKFVSAIVTNLGELKDNFTLFIINNTETKLYAEIYRQATLEILPGNNTETLIMLTAKGDAIPGFENITVIAKSMMAEGYDLDVQDSKELIVKILEKDKPMDRNKSTSSFYFSILFLIILLIIIFIIIVILLRRRSSKKASGVVEKKESTPETPSETSSETPTEALPETPPETQPENQSETQPETSPETPPETSPETSPETPPETSPETPPETLPEASPEDTTGNTN